MDRQYYDPIYLFFYRTRVLRNGELEALEELRKAAWSEHHDSRLVALCFLHEIGSASAASPFRANLQEAR